MRFRHRFQGRNETSHRRHGRVRIHGKFVCGWDGCVLTARYFFCMLITRVETLAFTRFGSYRAVFFARRGLFCVEGDRLCGWQHGWCLCGRQMARWDGFTGGRDERESVIFQAFMPVWAMRAVAVAMRRLYSRADLTMPDGRDAREDEQGPNGDGWWIWG